MPCPGHGSLGGGTIRHGTDADCPDMAEDASIKKFRQLPDGIQMALQEYAETCHDNHLCFSEEVDCSNFKTLVEVISEALTRS